MKDDQSFFLGIARRCDHEQLEAAMGWSLGCYSPDLMGVGAYEPPGPELVPQGR